jgi:hypothetical protein
MSNAIHEVLDRWTAAFNSHQMDAITDLFTADALFQGFGPEVLSGQKAVRGYYEAVPGYRSADDVSLLHSYEIGDQMARGRHVPRPFRLEGSCAPVAGAQAQRRRVADPSVSRLAGQRRALKQLARQATRTPMKYRG